MKKILVTEFVPDCEVLLDRPSKLLMVQLSCAFHCFYRISNFLEAFKKHVFIVVFQVSKPASVPSVPAYAFVAAFIILTKFTIIGVLHLIGETKIRDCVVGRVAVPMVNILTRPPPIREEPSQTVCEIEPPANTDLDVAPFGYITSRATFHRFPPSHFPSKSAVMRVVSQKVCEALRFHNKLRVGKVCVN